MQNQSMTDTVEIKPTIKDNIRENKGLYSVMGLFFVLFGMLAIIWPTIFAVTFNVFFGAFLVVGGVLRALGSYRAKAPFWSFVLAVIAFATGVLLLANPFTGTVAIGTVIAVYILMEGVAQMLFGFQLYSVANWGWVFAAGLIAVLLGAAVLAGFPSASIVLLGVLVGLNFMFYGIGMLAVTVAAE